MASLANLDPDLLRAFAFIAEEGSFTRAARRLGRTQSAVSMQMQRLEGQLGRRLLERGRGESVQLTPHGHYLLERSRELLALNDAIWTTFRAPDIVGTVRLGTPDDYALRFLPGILRRFADTHPGIEVEVECAPSDVVVDKLRAGELDLTLCSEGHAPAHWPAQVLRHGPLSWVTSDRHAPHRRTPLPLAVATGNCQWRKMAVRVLEQAGMPFRIAYSSASLAGSLPPVVAGLAVTVAPETDLPAGLRALKAEDGLPALGRYGILLLKNPGGRQPLTDVLADHIVAAFGPGQALADAA